MKLLERPIEQKPPTVLLMKSNLQVPDHMPCEKQNKQIVKITLPLSNLNMRFIYVSPYFYMNFYRQTPALPSQLFPPIKRTLLRRAEDSDALASAGNWATPCNHSNLWGLYIAVRQHCQHLFIGFLSHNLYQPKLKGR